MIKLTGLGGNEPNGLYIGRPNPLGNPFNTKKSNIVNNLTVDLKTSLKKYRIYLLELLASEEENKQKKIFKILLKRLKNNQDIQLNCWCCYKEYKEIKVFSEYNCHGEVIIEILFDLLNNNYIMYQNVINEKIIISGYFPIYINNWLNQEAIQSENKYELILSEKNKRIIENIEKIIDLYKKINL